MGIPRGCWVAIADAERYLVLENNGDEELVDLRVLATDTHDVPMNRDLKADRPGRFPASGGRRGAVSETDWKRLEKTVLPEALARFLSERALENAYQSLVVAADPRTLGYLRKHMHPVAKDRLRLEISADHTHKPISEIEKIVTEIARSG